MVIKYHDELHIPRCLENGCHFFIKVYVIDSLSNDKTSEICAEFSNVEFVQHKLLWNQAERFNWALENVKIGFMIKRDLIFLWVSEFVMES